MTDGPSSNGNGDSSSEGGIWRGLRSLLFGEEQNETLRERIEDAIDAAEEGTDRKSAKGDLSPLERKMLRNLLHFGERDAGDVGVPRADIIAVDEATSFAELVQIFAEAGHSRLPVYREKLDAAPWSEDEKARVIDEVLVAYRFNTELFEDLARAKAAQTA